MSKSTNEELMALIEKAVAGDKKSLETVLSSVQELVFNLSLRMLGTFPDAEDASQDILIKVMTHLSSYKGESAFSTWVFRIAANHLKDSGCGKIDFGGGIETVMHECHAAMFGRREPVYFHFRNYVQNRQPDCRGYPWDYSGGIQAEAGEGTAEDGRFPFRLLRRIRKGEMQVCGQGKLRNPKPQAHAQSVVFHRGCGIRADCAQG